MSELPNLNFAIFLKDHFYEAIFKNFKITVLTDFQKTILIL